MDLGLMALLLGDEEERKQHHNVMRIRRRRLRDTNNPLELPEENFVRLFRVTREVAVILTEGIDVDVRRIRSTGLPVHIVVLTAVRFYAVGSYQRCIGQEYNLALGQKTVSKVVREVSRAIVRRLFHTYVKFPGTAAERRAIVEGFQHKFGLPDCLDTSRNLYLLHILTWVMNMFGIFFILAAHEHYSIDVFIAFYITSRLFLYYHTLSNNQALMQNDSSRTRIWFPLLSFFESEVDGIVPNEYEGPVTILSNLRQWAVQLITDVKESSVAKIAGTKLQEGAAMGEYSVVKLVDGIKRNLSMVEEYKTSRQRLVTLDKNIQACLLDERPDVEIRHRNIAEFPGEALLKDFSNPPSPVMKKNI